MRAKQNNLRQPIVQNPCNKIPPTVLQAIVLSTHYSTTSSKYGVVLGFCRIFATELEDRRPVGCGDIITDKAT